MNNIEISLQVIIVLIMIVVLIKVNKKDSKAENYCVDISGGFKAPCDGVGRCVVDV
jgi:hypothetical protein